MTTEVLNQLRALRESIAEGLRKDPRYLTLAALDKSIVEISGVLTAVGITPPEQAAVVPLHFAPSPQAAAAPAAAPAAANPEAFAPATVAPAAVPFAPEVASPALPLAAAHVPAAPTAPAAAEVPVKKKKKSLNPLVETAAALAVAGIAAEVIHEHRAAAAKPAAKEAPAPGDDGHEEPGEAKHHPENEEPAADEAGDDAENAAGDKDKAGDKDEDENKDQDGGDDKADESPDNEAKDGGEGHGDKDEDGHDKGGDDEKADEAAVIPKGKASGYTPMAPKAGANQYQPAMSVKFGKLPNKVDLRPLMTPIEDQGDTSSCVANAVAGAYEYWIKKASKQDHNISRLFVYYNARWRDGSQDKDEGSVIQLAMEGLSKFGACNEKVWPFDTHLVLKKPGAEAYQDAAPYKVHDMAQVPLKLEAWKQALAEGKPIVFGCELFDSFDECSKRGGVVPMPAPDDIARKKHSGHSMCAVGYSDTEKVFIVRNSWGADWGDKGYCYMPYAYLMSDKFNDGDCWVFIPKVPSQPPREVWSDDTKPVTNGGDGVTFPIETYTIADYAKITVDLFEKVRKPFNGIVLPEFSSYVSFAGKGLWSEMETFDFRTFLTSTAALAGVAAVASEFSSSSSTSTSTSVSSSSSSSTSESSEDKESDKEQDEDEEADEAADEDKDEEDSDKEDDVKDDSEDDKSEDADKDDDAKDEESEGGDAADDKDEDSDEDGDKDDDSEDEKSEDGDEDKDEDSDEESEDGAGDDDSDGDESGDGGEDSDDDSEDAAGDDDSENDEDEDAEDEPEDDDGGGDDDDGGGDDGGDEGGDDD